MSDELTPVTRLEGFLTGDEQLTPVTRLEKILAGEDVEPVTRLEQFLKMAAGGGGEFTQIVNDTITVENTSSTAQIVYTFTYTPSSAPSSCLVLISANNPATGQFCYYCGLTLIKDIVNITSAPKAGIGLDQSGTTSSNNNAGVYLYTVTLTGAPSAPVVTVQIRAKSGSPFSTPALIDGTYHIDAYII